MEGDTVDNAGADRADAAAVDAAGGHRNRL